MGALRVAARQSPGEPKRADAEGLVGGLQRRADGVQEGAVRGGDGAHLHGQAAKTSARRPSDAALKLLTVAKRYPDALLG